MPSLWESDRLIYRTLEKEDESLFLQLTNDSTAYMNLVPFLPTPVGKKNFGEFFEYMDKAMLVAAQDPGSVGTVTSSKIDQSETADEFDHMEYNSCFDVYRAELKLTPPVQVVCLKDSEKDNAPANTEAAPVDNKTAPTKSDGLASLIAIGWVGLIASDPKEAHHRRTEVGINILKPFQGRGYGSEAILWALDWGFRFANIHRCEIRAFGYNKRARDLYQRIGFVPEGVQRDFLFHDGCYHDIYHLSMLEEEWRSRYHKKVVQNGLGV